MRALSARRLASIATLLGSIAVGVLVPSGAHAGGIDYTLAASVALPGEPDVTIAVDFTGDGFDDAIVSTVGTTTLSLFASDGAGGLTPQPPLDPGGTLRWAAAGDFVEDGFMDLVLALDNGLQIRSGNGSGVFTLVFGGGGLAPLIPGRFAVADVDGDTHLDVVLPQSAVFTGNITILSGDGLGGLLMTGFTPYMLPPVIAHAGDFDADGLVDIAVGTFLFLGPTQTPGSLAIQFGIGGGMFGAPVEIATGVFNGMFAVGDFNADTLTDFAFQAAATATCQEVRILVGQPPPGPPVSPGPIFPIVDCSPLAIAFADFENDGDRDLLFTLPGAAPVTSIALNDAGALTGPFPLAVTGTHNGFSPSVGQFFGDATPELLYGMSSSSSIELYAAGPGSATFERGDSNVDGNFDIGDAVFTLAVLFQAGGPDPVCEDAVDANDDGDMNIADAIFSLGTLFSPGSPNPAPPFGACGPDPTPDGLDCAAFPPCP